MTGSKASVEPYHHESECEDQSAVGGGDLRDRHTPLCGEKDVSRGEQRAHGSDETGSVLGMH